MKPKGLYLRNEVWHIDKVIAGTRIQRSAHTKNLAEASEIVRQIETAALSRNASAEWSQVVEEMMSDKGSWLWKTIQRINKPSVTKSKGHSTVNPETLRLLLLRSDGKCELTGIPF
ncbi:hypothetical protein [Halopseudomonas aestusnigri]|uniref:hypothetical protein n=1 Tax=Halopseudomonas aestusnigri TaxID=857252 RepID=UPI0030032492